MEEGEEDRGIRKEMDEENEYEGRQEGNWKNWKRG